MKRVAQFFFVVIVEMIEDSAVVREVAELESRSRINRTSIVKPESWLGNATKRYKS